MLHFLPRCVSLSTFYQGQFWRSEVIVFPLWFGFWNSLAIASFLNSYGRDIFLFPLGVLLPRLGRDREAVGCLGPTRLRIVGLVRLEAIGGDTCVNEGLFLLFRLRGGCCGFGSPFSLREVSAPLSGASPPLPRHCCLSHPWCLSQCVAGCAPLDQMFQQHVAKLPGFHSFAPFPLCGRFHHVQPLPSRYQIFLHHLEIASD